VQKVQRRVLLVPLRVVRMVLVVVLVVLVVLVVVLDWVWLFQHLLSPPPFASGVSY